MHFFIAIVAAFTFGVVFVICWVFGYLMTTAPGWSALGALILAWWMARKVYRAMQLPPLAPHEQLEKMLIEVEAYRRRRISGR
jgi:hypothetical protein